MTYQSVPSKSRSRSDAKPDVLDRSGDSVDRHDVADAVLVLEDHEDTGEEVANDGLRTEADRDTGDSGAGESGAMLMPSCAEREQDRRPRR